MPIRMLGLPWPRTPVVGQTDYAELTRRCLLASWYACGRNRAAGLQLLTEGLRAASERHRWGDYRAPSLVAAYIDVIHQYRAAYGQGWL
jgi:hypothetical protein